MRGDPRHLAPVRGNASGAVECTEPGEQIPRAAQLCGGRRVQPAQRPGITCTPARQLQRQRREVGVGNLGRRERCQSRLGTLAPRPVADTRRQAAGTALALIRGGARDALGLQAAHARDRIEACAAHQSRVDDHAHARNGETRLRNVRGEHDLAHPAYRRRQRRILLLARQVAEQRQDPHTGAELRGVQPRLHPADLAPSR